MANYIEKIRKKLGSEKFIHPGVRIIIENEAGEILFVARKDNGKLGLPAGGLEENETLEACMIREVKEETGLDLLAMEVIGISSSPARESVTYPNGDEVQYFTIEFYSNQWKGTIQVNKNEITHAAFLDRSNKEKLPPNEKSTFESLEHYKKEHKIKLK